MAGSPAAVVSAPAAVVSEPPSPAPPSPAPPAASGSSGGSTSSVGGSHEPSVTAAATVAMCSGLAVTRPWPIEAAAFSVASAGSG